MLIDGHRISLAQFWEEVCSTARIWVSPPIIERLQKRRTVVDAATCGDTPVYGLNTGLGANLGHRIDPKDITVFQHQLIAGRAVATGAALIPVTGRAKLLARILSASKGHSGISFETFEHLVAVFNAHLSPMVPKYGSIGASDLTQNAVWANALLGKEGLIWTDWMQMSGLLPADEALKQAGLTAPDLQPKDAMALINHSALTVALSAEAIESCAQTLAASKTAALLSFEGFAANPAIFAPKANTARAAPGQADMAAWFASHLSDANYTPHRIQDALSFRTIAPVFGAAQSALNHAISVFEDELNGASDSPIVTADGDMASTANFHNPALALALENLTLAMSMVANSATQRINRMMDPALSGLPKYLSPIGGASAGLVPLQKTAAALNADIRRHAMPVAFDPAPVSDGVEDMAPMTPSVAQKLSDQMEPFDLLIRAELFVAAQAIHLRDNKQICATNQTTLDLVRAQIPPLTQDRALGRDLTKLSELCEDAAAGLYGFTRGWL